MEVKDIDKLLEQLEFLTASPPQDQKLQQRLYDAAQQLSLAVEAPLDTVYRVIYSVCVWARKSHNGSEHELISTTFASLSALPMTS